MWPVTTINTGRVSAEIVFGGLGGWTVVVVDIAVEYSTQVGGHDGRRAADIARDIRTARETVGLTQADLSARAGVSLTTLTNFERGALPRRSNALRRVVAAIAEAQTEQKATAGG